MADEAIFPTVFTGAGRLPVSVGPIHHQPMPTRRFAMNASKGRCHAAALAAAMLFLVAGCATVRFTPTGESFPAHSGTVKILKAYPTDAGYSEIGWVSADGDFNTPWSELLGLMQKEAANHGANAIVLEEKFTTQLDTPQYSVGVNQQNDVRSVTAVAIRIKNP
jgi:hypothetical protein